MAVFLELDNFLYVLFQYAEGAEVVVHDDLLYFRLTYDLLARILLLHRLYDVNRLDFCDVLSNCATFAVPPQSAVFEQRGRMNETLDYTIGEASVAKIAISWQECIGQFLIFLIGSLVFTLKLFVLQTLDFIFLNHVIPAGSRFVRAFFG